MNWLWLCIILLSVGSIVTTIHLTWLHREHQALRERVRRLELDRLMATGWTEER